jgi:hypothetical protein
MSFPVFYYGLPMGSCICNVRYRCRYAHHNDNGLKTGGAPNRLPRRGLLAMTNYNLCHFPLQLASGSGVQFAMTNYNLCHSTLQQGSGVWCKTHNDRG